jgi:hypothetical protein
MDTYNNGVHTHNIIHTAKFSDYCKLRSRLSAGDVGYFERYLKSHILKQNMASLRSRFMTNYCSLIHTLNTDFRCTKGNTLFHMATILGSEVGIKVQKLMVF